MGLDNAAVVMRRKRYSRGRTKWYAPPQTGTYTERKAHLHALFAHLPRPFNDGGYLRGKGWAGLVYAASGHDLYRDLLTPLDAERIARGLRTFDWETYLAQVLPRENGAERDERERLWRSELIPGLTGYFQTCADHTLGIVSWD